MIMPVVQTIAGLLGLVVSIAGIAVSAMYVGKVKGAGLLLAGFALQAFAQLIYRLASFVVGTTAGSGVLPAFAFASLASVAGGACLVAGVYTVLGHVGGAPRS